MNTHADYRHHRYQFAEPPSPPDESAVNDLAHIGDPSLPATPAPRRPGKAIAWVRPTELASYAGPAIGRGIDLQAELIRRARRAPTSHPLHRRSHHATPSSSSSSSPTPTPTPTSSLSSSNRPEGLQL